MKKLTYLLSFFLFTVSLSAQQYNYEASWNAIEGFEKEGLPKSALKVVEAISEQAKKENNVPQQIKTLIFKSKFALILEEDAQLNIINDFKNEIKQNASPIKNILEGLLANLYWQYFNENRWRFYNRTKTLEKADTNDFRTWDLQTLFNEIHLLYQNALQNAALLQNEALSHYDILLQKHKDSKVYRPTLFDFLSHQALEFYKTDETNITKPAYKFEIDNPDFLSKALTFSKIKLQSQDSTSLQLNALKVFQSLIKCHLKDKEPYALTHVNIERLKFIKEHATFSDKEDCFLETLKAESEALKKHETSGLYRFEMASILNEQSKTYQNEFEEDYRWKAKEALTICNEVIDQFPKSKGAEKGIILKSQIEAQTLQIKTESFLPIQKHARLLVRYKNIDTLQFNIFKLTRSKLETFEKIYNKEKQLTFIKKLDAHKSWESTLKNENDYQSHTTEILVPKLYNGSYLIFASQSNNEDSFAFSTIQVTNLALVETEIAGYKTFQIIDRNTGKPINNAIAELSYTKNYKGKKTIEQKTPNEFGEISIPKFNTNYRDLNVEITTDDEVANFGTYYVYDYYRNNKEDAITYKSFLFTDRSIYRPGQTVYFKSMLLEKHIGKSKPFVEETVFATLYNTNGEKLSELDLETNTFGSVSGEFVLPNTGLNGEYYIEIYTTKGAIRQNHYFLVEEYKRPKFETTFLSITKTFKVNDSITITGNALAYAGSNITDAKVVYRVHRKAEYPHWYFWYRPRFNSQSQEIAYGETITHSKGEFEITFKAQPDESIDKNSLPIFNYEITADVTDLNGETRSATTTVKVGYHALVANINIEATLDKTKKDHTITIDTKNLNSEFVPAKGTIKIYKLKAPNRVLRPRPWAAPDYQTFSKEVFKDLFPHEAYTNEHEANHWEKGDLVFETPFDTNVSKTIVLGRLKKWQSGQYLITLESRDAFGQLVKDNVKTTLYSTTDTTLADNQLFNISSDKPDYKLGETTTLTLASAAKNINVTLRIEKDEQIVKTEIIPLNNNKKTITIPVETKDMGGFAVHYSFAAFNSFKSGTIYIAVPYPKTELHIETETFRDKLQPGTDETWRFKISGPQGEKVSAELLASMYDASLDQFITHNWAFNPVNKPIYFSTFRDKATQSFATQNFRVYNKSRYITYPQQNYDSFNWFGFSLNNRWFYRNYVNSLRNKKASKHEAKYVSTIKKGYVSGVVSDENGLPLPGASVIIKNTTNGTTTDFDGNFSIKANSGDRLQISYVGYVMHEIVIKEKNNSFNITLFEDSNSLDEVVVTGMGFAKNKRNLAYSVSSVKAESIEADDQLNASDLDEEVVSNTIVSSTNQKSTPNFNTIKIRKNLQETAFFFPHLQTDASGNISFSFTTPEALTQWNLQLLAHTKTLESATKTLTTVTQKELMVLPNAPRFLREGDTITISTKIANLTEKPLSGQAKLILTDAISGKDITKTLLNPPPQGELEGDSLPKGPLEREFAVPAKGNTQVSWQLRVPDNVQAVQYKILAKSENYSDGEQNALPVLSNRMLVTETLPMWIKSNETRTFTLDKLKTNKSTTLKHHKLTLEITSNPAWYAVQALPYLMEYPHECNEQTFSRYYANALASHIANANPRIQEVFNQWKHTDAIVSNLEKNQELKSIIIQETPWLREAQSETEQKKRIALLFDLNKMRNELQSAINKLKANQMSSGAWAWFKGGRVNRYITQHIISGFGHLKQLSVASSTIEASGMIKKAIGYLDAAFVKEYKDLKKYDPNIDLTLDHLSYTQLHYLYMRSFYPEIKKTKEVKTITAYYQSQIQKYWLKCSLYSKGLMALISHRNKDDKETAHKILKSLKETSITNDELGMYWQANTNSWYWYQAPIETHALLIEAFSEIESHTQTIDNLKIWLLKNKQTNKWKTTKATTEAVYALLLQGSDWLSVTDMVDMVLGGQHIEPSKLEAVSIEAGTGYYKTSWNTLEIKPKMAEVKLTKKGNGIAWGSLYWQYFEDLDKITSAETPLKLKKKLFLKQNTDRGEEISEITKNTTVKVGDLVRVRIELRSDRAMEFIHMKDMRAAGLEPVNVLSQYKWQDGLGYYESTKDASTNFFFDYLPKGVYVFEYDLRVNNAGDMSNGITTIQSMYAPEFSSHSEGVRLLVN